MQVITSASSFDDDQARRPKKKKGKKGGQAVSASIDEKQTMMTASSGKTLHTLYTVCPKNGILLSLQYLMLTEF